MYITTNLLIMEQEKKTIMCNQKCDYILDSCAFMQVDAITHCKDKSQSECDKIVKEIEKSSMKSFENCFNKCMEENSDKK